jgi:hypothetical protein
LLESPLPRVVSSPTSRLSFCPRRLRRHKLPLHLCLPQKALLRAIKSLKREYASLFH